MENKHYNIDFLKRNKMKKEIKNKTTYGAFLLSTFAMILISCTDFEVDNPTNILDGDLSDKGMANALGNTPEVAVAAALDDAIVWSAACSDEGFLSGSGTFRIMIDEGYMDGYNQQYDLLYDALASARWIAEDATTRLLELVDNPNADERVANGYFWGGIARLTLADHFNEVVIDGQAPITPVQATQSAIEKFESAATIAAAAGNTSLAAASHGAIARAYRSLYWDEKWDSSKDDMNTFKKASDAAKAALAISGSYVEYANYAPPGASNFVYESVNASRYNRMDPKYAYMKDPVTGEIDPRIIHGPKVNNSPRTGDPVYLITKYPNEGADIPVSRADEARLIIAEYAAMTSDLSTAVSMINDVRANNGLTAFSSTDQAEILTQLKYERSVELWYEGRRWQDMRYYEIIPNRWAEVNKTKGIHRRWPVSQLEKDNMK
ncbi:MAG: RagB/SusD family nutrient uptake outer membrane protein [Gammaproteobacteria bacterium]|jgi:predicted small secreted protein|nr:RagB/SusD family nutrient uptake outer membrane protein [Gammaproteobacteria bacterium]